MVGLASRTSFDDFITYLQALLLDMMYLQQDAFDEVDVAVSINRQKENFNRIIELVSTEYNFINQEQARVYFTKLTGLTKNLNYV